MHFSGHTSQGPWRRADRRTGGGPDEKAEDVVARDDTQKWLEQFLATEGGVAGTVHYEEDGDLVLAAAVHIPPEVRRVVAHVRRGKGMAGKAQVQRAPVQTCNLQSDAAEIPALARQVSGLAAAALPVLAGEGAVRAVVGISFGHEGEIPPDRLESLMQAAATVPG